MSRFDTTIIDLIESSNKNFKANPLNLGGFPGSGGGVGSPPGGYIGWLPQTRVAYDEEELATLATSVSGSLLDNLNHIRYWIANISGGGGIDEGAADLLYLRLDATNDPVTSQLNIVPTAAGDGGLYVETHGDAYPGDFEQISNSATNVTSPALFVLQSIQSTGSHLFNSHLIYGYRHRTGPSTGIYDSDYIRMEHSVSGVQFNVDKDGHAYDNGDILITEAPIDGVPYSRKNGGWVVASGGGSSALTVMDADATPTVTNVDTIIFSGFLVESLGSGDVRVTISGFGAAETYINQTPDNGTYGLLSGSVNSSNAIFTVSAGSYISGSLSVFLNGQYQTQGSSNDWTETSPAAGTFTFVTAPTTGDIVTATYSKVNTSFGNADTVDGLHASSFAFDSEWDSGWIQRTETWTRTGNHTFTVTGNQTTTFRKGTKIRYKDGGSYEYGVVASSAFSSVTTVTLITNSDYAMAAVTITDTYISYIENPEGFPHWFNWSPTYSGSASMTYTSVTTDSAKWSVVGKMCNIILRAFGTVGGTPDISLLATVPVNIATSLDTAISANIYDSGGKAAFAIVEVSTQKFKVTKYDASNWGAGTTKYILIQGSYEF